MSPAPTGKPTESHRWKFPEHNSIVSLQNTDAARMHTSAVAQTDLSTGVQAHRNSLGPEGFVELAKVSGNRGAAVGARPVWG